MSTEQAVASGEFDGAYALDASAELDLTNEGFSVERTNWQITKAIVESPDPGKKRAVVEFTAQVEGRSVSVTDRFWMQYTGSGDAQKDARTTSIGRGQLKRLFNAAFGSPKGSVAALQGRWVSAEGSEDEQGFRRLRGMRGAEGAGSVPNGAGLPTL